MSLKSIRKIHNARVKHLRHYLTTHPTLDAAAQDALFPADLVSDPESPAAIGPPRRTAPGAALFRYCSMLAVLVFLSKLFEAVLSASEPPESLPKVSLLLMMFCSQMAVQAKGIRYLPSRLQASWAF